MELMTRIRVSFPTDTDAELKASILKLERERGAELRATGRLIRAWRVPGSSSSILLWRVKDPTELHSILAGLPVYPWIAECNVEALAEHPIDPTSHEVASRQTA
jgi:muconolactone delta-isomerase